MCMSFIKNPFRRNKRNRNAGATPMPSAYDVETGTKWKRSEKHKAGGKAAEKTAAPATTASTTSLQAQSPAAMAIAMAASFAATGRPSKTLSTITSVDSFVTNNMATSLQGQESSAAPVANTSAAASDAAAAAAARDDGVPAVSHTGSTTGRKKNVLEWFGMSKKKASIDSL